MCCDHVQKRVNVNASHPYTTTPFRHMYVNKKKLKGGSHPTRITARKIDMLRKEKCFINRPNDF